MSNDKKPYFPLFVDLNEKQIVVVGAGTIAKRRIRTLVSFTNHLTVIAPEVNRELLDMEKAGMLRIKRKNYERKDIYDADYVIAATNDHQINSDIYSACKCMGITVNVCSDKTKCDFYFPGIAKDGDTVVGITSGGGDHRLAAKISVAVRQILRTIARKTVEKIRSIFPEEELK